MLFNSIEYIFLLLPISLIIYFYLNRHKLTIAAKAWLSFVSLFFYGWWNVIYIPLLLGTIVFNYTIGMLLREKCKYQFNRKYVLFIGIAFNVLMLCYYKYSNFLIANINYLGNYQLSLINVVLPLGISFFTFTQIAYLIDAYRGIAKEYSLINYGLFVTFFPHLLAGPIIHHKEIMPQFDNLRKKLFNSKNFSRGLFLFSIGLFKKVIFADNFAILANIGYNNSANLPLVEAWVTSLSYSLQIYFDFSGYTDMAIGAALMFNIRLPCNFNSPYKSLDIREFWRRWHITLSRFLRDYVYIPLGGNRISESRTLTNLMLTFLIGGIWHGAGWTFILWGALHGTAIVLYRLWKKFNLTLPRLFSWIITINFINITWIFFRAKNIDEALRIIKGMFGFNGITFPSKLEKLVILKHIGVKFGPLQNYSFSDYLIILAMIQAIIIVLLTKNSQELTYNFRPTLTYTIASLALFTFPILSLIYFSSSTEFLYYQF